MSEEAKRRGSDSDSSPIDWSSSPIDWSSSPIDWSSSRAAPAPFEVEAEPPPEPQVPRAASDDDSEVEVAPEDLEDLFDEPARVERQYRAAQPQRASRGEPEQFPTPAARPTRSPFAALLYLAFAGYLGWVAVLCYQDLGALHARSLTAAPHELQALRATHEKVTWLVVLNAAPAACFLLGAFSLLGRSRGAGLCFGFVALGAVIFALHLTLSVDRTLLRPDDVLFKLCGIALVAWFRPRAP